MTTEFIDLKENMTVEKAFEVIKNKGPQKETLYNCFVLTVDRKLIGVLDIKNLLIADTDELVKDLMDTNVIKVGTLEDQEEVTKMFDKYDCVALPVVDKENRLVGIITIDDAVDVMHEEVLEDFEKMAAITPNDNTYFKTSSFTHAKNRILWLLLLMLSTTITGTIMAHFENIIAVLPILVAFIPMLMDTGGNAGGQASATIIRALSLKDIEFRDLFKVIWKEIRVAILCGLTLMIANYIKLLFIDKVEVLVAIVVCSTLFMAIVVAKVIGCTLPMVAKKIGFDPAVMASPFITTLVDAVSLLTYFQIASHLLNL
jgi:magnesium transporter